MQYIDKDGARHDIPMYGIQPTLSPDTDNALYESENGLKVNAIRVKDSVPVGFIGYFGANSVPESYLVCDGSAVSRISYKELFDVIGTTFGTGNGSTTFNLPNLIDRFPQGKATVGTQIAAGLPNITARAGFNYIVSDGYVCFQNYSGAFYRTDAGEGAGGRKWPGVGSTGDGRNYPHFRFDASRSNNIYGKSSTVQPPALTLLPCIKAYSLKFDDTFGDLTNSIKINPDSDNILKKTDTGLKVSGGASILSNVKMRTVWGLITDTSDPFVQPKETRRFYILQSQIRESLGLSENIQILGGDNILNFVSIRNGDNNFIVQYWDAQFDTIWVDLYNPSDKVLRADHVVLTYLLTVTV